MLGIKNNLSLLLPIMATVTKKNYSIPSHMMNLPGKLLKYLTGWLSFSLIICTYVYIYAYASTHEIGLHNCLNYRMS